MNKQMKSNVSIINRCAGRVLAATTLLVLASTASAQQRIFITPAQITPDANGIVEFSVAAEGVTEPGFSSYALSLRFDGADAINLTEQIGAVPGYINTAQAPADKVTCSAKLAPVAPSRLDIASEVHISSGQGNLVIQGENPDQNVLCAVNRSSGNEGSYNCGIAGSKTQTGAGSLVGYKCFVGPDVPEGTMISVTPGLLPDETGALFLLGQSEPRQSGFESGQIIVKKILPSDTPLVNSPLKAGDSEIAGRSEPNARIRLFVNAAEAATTDADSTGAWSLRLATVLAPGDIVAATATAPEKRESALTNPIRIHATPVNTPPVAEAGAPKTVSAGGIATLDGSGSTDADGDALTYRWSLTSVPEGSIATLSNSTTARPAFEADLPGE